MTWVFDPNHSQVLYACRYLGLSLITGSFQDVKAEVDVESSNHGQWSVSARSLSIVLGIATTRRS